MACQYHVVTTDLTTSHQNLLNSHHLEINDMHRRVQGGQNAAHMPTVELRAYKISCFQSLLHSKQREIATHRMASSNSRPVKSRAST